MQYLILVCFQPKPHDVTVLNASDILILVPRSEYIMQVKTVLLWMPMSSTPSGDLSASTLPNMKKSENKICYVFCHQANLLKRWLNPRSDDNFVGGHIRRD